jgi:hypothetical protein
MNSIPWSWPVDPSAEFEAGMIMGLTVLNNMVQCTNSNGLSVIGIVDDYKVKSHVSTSWDESICVPATGVMGPNNQLVTPVDIKVELKNPNVMPSSFISIPVPVELIPRNGVIVFPAGTPLNYDLLGTGSPNALKTSVRYQYSISNIPGDDSTASSGRCTVWLSRGLFITDKFETNQIYPLNANLFVSEYGLLTTRQATPQNPAVAIVTGPPNAITNSMEFLWL